MSTFVCNNRRGAFFKGRLYAKGETFEGDKANKHFDLIEGPLPPEILESNIMRTISDAVNAMDHDDFSLWTASGEPKVKVIEEMTGLTITRQEIEEASNSVRRGYPHQALKDTKTMNPSARD